MATAISKLTSQGQVSVPASVRKALGVGPGSSLEWEESAGKVLVRRAARYSSIQIHAVLFPEGAPAPLTTVELKDAVRQRMRTKYASR